MSEKHEAIESEDWEPTPEEEKNMERYRQMLARYPTFAILLKVLNRHRVVRTYEKHGVKNPIIVDSAQEHLAGALDELCTAFPTDPDSVLGHYSLRSILDAVVHEFNPPKGDFDA